MSTACWPVMASPTGGAAAPVAEGSPLLADWAAPANVPQPSLAVERLRLTADGDVVVQRRR